MKIALSQRNFIVGDIAGNAAKILEHYRTACEQGADLVVSSELGLFGYPPKDLLLSSHHLELQRDWEMRIGFELGHVPLVLGVAEQRSGPGKPLANAVVILEHVNDTVYPTSYHKKLLPTYDVFDEGRYFEPGGSNYLNMSFQGTFVTVLVCEDIWGGSELQGHKPYQRDPVAEIASWHSNFPYRHPDVLVVINGSPYYWGKGDVRRKLVSGIAQKLNCSVVYVNEIGGNDDLIFDGRSFAVNSKGEVIGAANVFQEDLIVVDTESTAPVTYPSDSESLFDLYPALVLGVQDYAQKLSIPGVLVAVSGGIDSAVTACIAREALGPERVKLYSMPSPFSSRDSVVDAKQLADNLGVPFEIIPITDLYTMFREVASDHFEWNEPGTKEGDVTAENVQARLRGLFMMALSNWSGWIVLATGNKSELATGYCTLYGDMAGGLGVISDVFKTTVYDLARHINLLHEWIPQNSLTKPPSAELRPNQQDTDSLPPYELLDQILKLYIDRELSPEEIIDRIGQQETVLRVIRMVTGNEYKRRQAPVGLKVSPKAFGSGRRFPIAARFF